MARWLEEEGVVAVEGVEARSTIGSSLGLAYVNIAGRQGSVSLYFTCTYHTDSILTALLPLLTSTSRLARIQPSTAHCGNHCQTFFPFLLLLVACSGLFLFLLHSTTCVANPADCPLCAPLGQWSRQLRRLSTGQQVLWYG